MTEITDIDKAVAALADAPDDAARNLAVHARFAECEIFLVLETEAEGETVKPLIMETSTGRLVLGFDRDIRMTAFMGGATAYIALAGRKLAQLLKGQELGIALNLGTSYETVITPDAVNWITQTLDSTAKQVEARITEITPPGLLPHGLLEALDRRISALSGVADAALLGGAKYENNMHGHILGIVNAGAEAQEGIAYSIGEALRLSGLEAGSLDVLFLSEADQITQALSRNGLRFDIASVSSEAPPQRKAPGTDPDTPPRLR